MVLSTKKKGKCWAVQTRDRKRGQSGWERMRRDYISTPPGFQPKCSKKLLEGLWQATV